MTSQFLNTVEETIATHRLLTDKARPVIVGISGGADSVALLVALTRLGYNCIAAHCNFNLRGEESLRDMLHAEKIANRLETSFILKKFNVAEYLSDNKSTSIEMACRDLRYKWFAELTHEYSAQAIAVGHNADDNIETFMLNMQRGTGISGLRGMRPKNDRGVIRPLLRIHRNDIETFLSDNGFDFIVDSSNLSNEFSRNKVRNSVIPAFLNCFSNFRKGMDMTISEMAMCESFYRQCVEEKSEQYMDSTGIIDLCKLIEKEPHAPLLIYEWLRSEGISFRQAEDIISSVNKSGATFNTRQQSWYINRGKLMTLQTKEIPNFTFEDFFTIETHSIDIFNPSGNPNEAYFDESVLAGEPLSYRTWQQGDRLKPYGMKGSKKISDIFNDAKIPLHLKSRIPLLTKGNDILWVAGIRASSLYPVTSASNRFIRISYRDELKF